MKLKKIIQEIDLGNKVFCDVCNGDFTNSDEQGGFVFGSKGYCPKCAKERLPAIKGYSEENYIKAFCPENMSFKDFILKYRNGNNFIRVYSF